MVNIVLLFCLLNFSFQPQNSVIPESQNGITLTVHVSNFDSDAGQVRSGLYNSKETWIKTEFGKFTTTIQNKKATLYFYNVPPGEYGISMYHDENKNYDFDRTLGIPTEPYAVSNNAKRMFAAPLWEECKFTVGTSDMEIKIKF